MALKRFKKGVKMALTPLRGTSDKKDYPTYAMTPPK